MSPGMPSARNGIREMKFSHPMEFLLSFVWALGSFLTTAWGRMILWHNFGTQSCKVLSKSGSVQNLAGFWVTGQKLCPKYSGKSCGCLCLPLNVPIL
ncbi:hypothetical protein K470DRAFT_101554 [Piedraia hortae CBS 480.64]|uniref:Uncharacterized protein n=1 Tax=Piedraia hortae CBS 480.64 TaxID=1314780 RepID=A0A6A7BX04_9PEZI|nr:hypothetical protein K470DRAFT_101554 [Piedraia hortae CBS 480.64]